MEQSRELLNNYYSNTDVFYDTSEIEIKLIKISSELVDSFTLKQKMLFDEYNVLMQKKKTKDDLHLVDFFILNYLKNNDTDKAQPKNFVL